MGSAAIRMCVCIFFTFAIISSARLTLSFSENEEGMVKGRSLLLIRTNDYDEPSANGRHDPPGRRGGGGRRG
ncbi:PREDICTED: protein PSY3-like [Tarenaya hassleriana]|uniref:protein PSY3-like n=1 Tax=Tarenaya hassleriana TaxID=28532 RepID=UPI0008FCE62D|nr:PREDICTED: protein PSY3-like [Tarenaya hassleriana]